MILTRDGKEITAIYKQDGTEVEEVKDASGRIVYSASREITGTLPLSFSGRGKPLTDYLISGNISQDGAPTPEAPVGEGVGTRTENLFDKDAQDTANGYEAGRYINSSGVTVIDPRWDVTEYIPCIQRNVYCFSNCVGHAASICWYDSNKNFISGSALSIPTGFSTIVITSPTNASYVRTCVLLVHSGSGSQQYDRNVDVFMITLGSTPPDHYTPYGYKLPLTINSTEYPIYLGQVEMTRRIKKLVLTGNEQYTKLNSSATNYAYYFSVISPTSALGILCSHLPVRATGASDNICIVQNQTYPNTIYMNFGADVMNAQQSGNTVDGLKEYLATQYATGTPVCVWYVLATPQTAVVNEPLHKIGDYADTISFAQAGVTLPTTAGSNTFTVGTTVQPSAASITGNIKPTGYGKLVDKNGVYILDKNGVQLTVHGQDTSN